MLFHIRRRGPRRTDDLVGNRTDTQSIHMPGDGSGIHPSRVGNKKEGDTIEYFEGA